MTAHRGPDLDLGVIGNCQVAGLIDRLGRLVWACLPRFDSDALFCSLLKQRSTEDDYGYTSVDLIDFSYSEQHYIINTAILVTRLYDKRGGAVEITDFAPRFKQFGRLYHPTMLVRQIRRIAHLRSATGA